MRSTISAIATTIYSFILSNRLKQTIPAQVPPFLIKAGLPATSVTAFLNAITVGTPAAFAAVPGITTDIEATGIGAYHVASADAYKTVFLSSIAFSGIAIITSFFVANVDHLMTKEVSTTLHDTKKENVVGHGAAMKDSEV